MLESRVDIKTHDGTADAFLYQPEAGGTWPAVIMYTDIKGVRPAFQEMAKRLSAEGYVVLLPNVYYRTRHIPVFKDEPPSFNDPNGRTQLLALKDTLTPERVERDAIAYVEFLGMHASVGGTEMGTVGYCMAGAIALRTAGARPDRIAAMASFHGGHLATDEANSPHILLPKVKARLYFGHASDDASCPPEMIRKLASACDKAHLRYESELYPGRHGFAVGDNSAFEAASADKHWQKMLALFKETLH
ncbi:MAG: dienelactone hydrolase family protein [Alphaproteobacteria bacterium]